VEAAGARGAVSRNRQAERAPAQKPDPVSWRRPSPRRVRGIRDRLRLVYGIPLAEPHGHPIAELILTVLSQSTNDRNRDVAYLALRERFPPGSPRASHPASLESAALESSGWEELRDAPVAEIEEAIRAGGISRVKSARIKSILRAITDTAPDRCLSLDWLAGQPVLEARRYLTSLPGVGRKTAACVLLFALGMREVPVDTHVSRVGTRLNLFRPGAPFEEMHDTMLAITPPGEELELHLNLLRHGRRTCSARQPDCAGCALKRMCPSAFRVGR
jgi:endonuclease III